MSDRHIAASLGCNPLKRFATLMISFSAWSFAFAPALAETTNSAVAPLTAPSLPDANLSIFRVFGALALVIGVFLGGVWLFKNWQRVTIHRGRAPKLNVVETRSLGGRHSLHVVGYEQERFLIAVSPSGVNMLTHLPTAADVEEPAPAKTSQSPSFAQALTQVLKGK
jgi:flagellar biogenesis protein FliO